MPAATGEIRNTLRQLEEELWRAETRFDRTRMDEVFAEDLFEFGRSGRRYTREELLDCEESVIDVVLPLPELEVRLLSPDVAQVTYTSVVTREGEVERSRRSSIWSLEGGAWRLRFHQGTPFVAES